MIILLSFALTLGGIGLYFLLLKLGFYRLYPIEMYALMALGVAVAFFAARGKGMTWRWLAAAGQGVLLVFMLGWTLLYSRLPPHDLPVRPGDAMLDFVLSDHEGNPFSSAALHGKTAALYVFYRGDW